MSRRPLRLYLFESLLFLTVVTFVLQVGYVFMPIFNDFHEPTPNGDSSNPDVENEKPGDEAIPGLVHVQERDVAINDAPLNDIGKIDQRLNHEQADSIGGNKVPKEGKVEAIKPAAQKPRNPKDPKPGPAKQVPQHPQLKPKNVAKAKSEDQLNAVQPKQNVCHKKILILGGMKIVETWHELTTLVNFLKQYPNENGVTYRAPLECPKQRCTVELTFSSNYTSQMPGKDAVILNIAPYTLKTHMSDLLQKNQPKDQLWMLYGVETALRIHKWMQGIGTLKVHGMWSYLTDSEIHMPYAYYKRGPPVTDKLRKPNKFWIESKTKLVAWMGSNCVKEVFWPRMGFIEELQKHVHVDTYGKCGNLTCLPRLSDECKNLMNSYKFYLSVENAECDEYITEKMWDTALQHGVVPVVYGAPKKDYERMAPPHSFIYAGDFKTVKDLADYLNQLDRRPDLYAKYFEWRYKGSVVQVYPDLEPSKFCQVLPYIDKLQQGKLEKKPVASFPWFNTCRTKITKPFNPKDVPSLQKWKPW